MGRVLVIWIVFWLAGVGPAEAAGTRWRVFSRSTASLRAVINGVPGRLDLAHFRCPLSLHVATCGATLFLGDPLVLNLLAHGGLRVMENVNWAEFHPNEWNDEARALRQLIRDPAHNSELYRYVELHLKEHQSRIEQEVGRKVHLRSGALDLSLYSQAEKQIPYPSETGRVWVTTPRVDIHAAKLLLQAPGDPQFHQSVFSGDSDWTFTHLTPFCGELLLFANWPT
jgi:hypothetical protein